MAISSRRSGSWSTPSAGTIRVKRNGVWNLALSVKMKRNGVWVDSGYVSYPNAATGFTGSGGNGDNRQVTFSWSAPSGGAPVTGYRLYIYNSSDVQIGSPVDTGNVGSYTYTFGSSNTTYYVRLKTLGAAGESQSFATNTAGGTRLRVVTGSPSSADTPNYGWSSTQYSGNPGAGTASSWSGRGWDNSYNPGLAFDNNGGTYWRSQWWDLPNIAWEWISFSVGAPYSKLKLNAVGFIPVGNGPGTFYLDYTDSAWNFAGTAGGPGGYAFGLGLIGCNIEIPQGQTWFFRINSTDMGYNPGYSNYNVQMSEIYIYYNVWTIVSYTPHPATSNSVSNA